MKQKFLLTYQKVQVIVHIVEQATDHCSQMDHFVGPVFFEEFSRRLQIAVIAPNEE